MFNKFGITAVPGGERHESERRVGAKNQKGKKP